MKRPMSTFLLVLLVGARMPGVALAEADSLSREYEVKAAFLYNFAKFVQWPAAASTEEKESRFILGILGDDPFGETLEQTLEGKTVQGRKVQIKRFKPSADQPACHLLFVCSSEKPRLESILQSLRSTNTLTVGEIEGFAERGGIINFKIVGNRVRFEVNREAAERAGLKISSKLLQLADVVGDRTDEG